jgi:hypothetical protein
MYFDKYKTNADDKFIKDVINSLKDIIKTQRVGSSMNRPPPPIQSRSFGEIINRLPQLTFHNKKSLSQSRNQSKPQNGDGKQANKSLTRKITPGINPKSVEQMG